MTPAPQEKKEELYRNVTAEYAKRETASIEEAVESGDVKLSLPLDYFDNITFAKVDEYAAIDLMRRGGNQTVPIGNDMNKALANYNIALGKMEHSQRGPMGERDLAKLDEVQMSMEELLITEALDLELGQEPGYSKTLAWGFGDLKFEVYGWARASGGLAIEGYRVLLDEGELRSKAPTGRGEAYTPKFSVVASSRDDEALRYGAIKLETVVLDGNYSLFGTEGKTIKFGEGQLEIPGSKSLLSEKAKDEIMKRRENRDKNAPDYKEYERPDKAKAL